jgi:AcrR family transcriptional regulator
MATSKTSTATRGRETWPTRAQPLEQAAVGRGQRQKIIAATVELVSKRGYSDTSAERICKKAGVSFPTFRKHFRDKEECFLASFDEAVADGIRRVAEASVAAGEDWAERVIAGLDAVLEGVAERPAAARLCLVEALSAGSAGIERYDAAVQRFVPWLREGREQMEDSSKLPDVLEETILGGVAWAIHRKVAVGEAAEAVELRDGLLGTLLTPYLGVDRTEKLIAREAARGSAGRL